MANSCALKSPRHTSLRQGLNHLGLQREDFQTERGRLHIVQLRGKPFEACPHETDPSFGFEREVSIFVDNAAQVRIRTGSSVYTFGQLLRSRAVKQGTSGSVFIEASPASSFPKS